jgi:type IV secretory pathway TraG/TraD family ATPase VirD4
VFFSSTARQLHQAGVTDLGQLYRMLTMAPAEELRILLDGTPARPFLDEGNERMFGSIRSVTSVACAPLDYINAQKARPFSIRDWIESGQGVLFLPYQADQIAALRSVISTWMRIAIFQTMSQGERDHRLWFVVDELDALGAIDSLKDALARLRKFGGRCVLGFQSIAQVSGTYGDAEAQTIVENCGNTLILRCSASEGGGTAQFASRLIGDREIVRPQTSYSRSDSILVNYQSSVTQGVQHVTEAAVLPSEIEQLPDLEGLVKFASSPQWLRVRLWRARPLPA